MKTENLKEVLSLEIIETINTGETGNMVITREVIERKGNKVKESYKMRYLSNDVSTGMQQT